MKTVEQKPDTEEVKALMDNVGCPWPDKGVKPPVKGTEAWVKPAAAKPAALVPVGCP